MSMSAGLAQAAQQAAMVTATQSAVINAAAAITAQQSFITESFRGQIYISDELDVQDTPVYDTDTYAAGASINTPNSQFFSNVEAGAGKNYSQTNMSENRRLGCTGGFLGFRDSVGLVGGYPPLGPSNVPQFVGV
jgi:hypothetical protein